jgi:hypothetical protein
MLVGPLSMSVILYLLISKSVEDWGKDRIDTASQRFPRAFHDTTLQIHYWPHAGLLGQ